jgi:arylsulfatase A-like enzyme
MNNKKNIAIIIVDALRTKNLSLHGYENETDKNLKRIAKKGIWFKQHFSPSNCTAPSVTSILTGLYPPNHGILHQTPYTKEAEIEKIKDVKFWLPSFLKKQGYETIAVDWISQWFEKGFDHYGEGEYSEEHVAPFKPAEEITNLAISKVNNSQKPFFLFLHYWDTHFPFPTIKNNKAETEQDLKETLESIKDENERKYLELRIANKGIYTISSLKEKYDQSIKVVDEQVGKFYDFLKEKNILDETLIFILGDHGMSLTEHGILFNPSGLYESSIRAPLILHFPGFEGKEISEFVQNIDIVPTILDTIQVNNQEKFDGFSLKPLIEKNTPLRDKVFSYDGLCEDVVTVRTKSKKFILAKDNFCNLCKGKHHQEFEEYNLEKDPKEMQNIFLEKSELMKYLN